MRPTLVISLPDDQNPQSPPIVNLSREGEVIIVSLNARRWPQGPQRSATQTPIVALHETSRCTGMSIHGWRTESLWLSQFCVVPRN